MSSPPPPPIRAVYFVAGEPGGGGICATVSLADAPPVGAWGCEGEVGAGCRGCRRRAAVGV